MTSTQMKAKKDTGNKGIPARPSHTRTHTGCTCSHCSAFTLILCPGLTDHEIVTQMTVLLAGGHEAVTLVLTLCAYSLATHPQSLRLLQQEVDSTFPDQVRTQPQRLVPSPER